MPPPRTEHEPKLDSATGDGNEGSIAASKRLVNRDKLWGVVGGNIGRNKLTANENAVEDYLLSMNHLRAVVDYFTINISKSFFR